MTDTKKRAEPTVTIDGHRYTASEFAAAKNLTVGGYLDLSGTQITALPEGLRVEGYLDLRDTQITALPEGLRVGGNLSLRDTQITALPEGLRVGGDLDLDPYEVVFDRNEGVLKIGCQHHSIGDWEAFTDNQIIGMDGKAALKFWRVWKAPLLAWATALTTKAEA